MSSLLIAGSGQANPRIESLALECVKRGHEIWILCEQSRPEQNHIRLTDDVNVLSKIWDLIIIYQNGSIQDVVLANSDRLVSPIFYIALKESTNPSIEKGKKYCDFIGYNSEMPGVEEVNIANHIEKLLQEVGHDRTEYSNTPR